MREARRLFSKHHSPSLRGQPSSVFRSKISRDFPDLSSRNAIGPGQYNISFPIVRPRLEAIRKNNNTVIIKVNQKLSPAFQSLEPRFKSPKVEYVNLEKEFNDDPKKQMTKSYVQNKQVEIGMKNRIKKLSDILNNQEQRFRKNLNLGTKSGQTQKLQNVKGSLETINSLKLYKKERQRLHFLLKQMKPSSQVKGPQWSKYRQTKGNLYSINDVPGPGTYKQPLLGQTRHRYYETIQEKSWQFKSSTRRDNFLTDDKGIIDSPSHQRFVSDLDGSYHKVDSIPLLHDKSVTRLEFDDQQN